MKQLTPLDSNFFFFEGPNQPMMIGSLWICDPSTVPHGKLQYEEILKYIEDRLCTTSIFRWRLQEAPLQLDEPYWLEDKDFDLEYHVHHVGLPQPGNWRQLCDFVSRSISRTVDLTRAPWEIWIIEGVNDVPGVPPDSFAVLIRFHHAYVDGKSSLALTVAMMEESPVHKPEAEQTVQYCEKPPTQTEMWMRTLPRLAHRSIAFYRAGFDVAVKTSELFARIQRDDILKQPQAPKTIFNTAVTRHRSYNSHNWKLSDLKRIRTLVKGISLNDVMIAVVAGGMRRYLLRREALPKEKSLVSLCPVALRKEDTQYDGGNLISAMTIPIGTNIADPVERLAYVGKITAGHIPVAKEVLYHLNNAIGDLYPAYMRAMFAWFQYKTKLSSRVPLINTVITNVPGVPGLVPKYFAGAKILSVHPLLPIADGAAISHVISGIYDDVTMGVVADRQVVPDMQAYIDCLQDSTREYLESLQITETEPKVTVVPSKTAAKEKPARRKSPAKPAIAPTQRKRPAKPTIAPAPSARVRVPAAAGRPS